MQTERKVRNENIMYLEKLMGEKWFVPIRDSYGVFPENKMSRCGTTSVTSQ